MAELRWGVATDSGLVRDANEDAYVVEPLLFGVADGMGGHRAGEVASALASATLRERLSGGAANVDVVIAAVLEANAAIFSAAHTNSAQQGMGTTVTALVVMAATGDEPEQLALVNVGDSRTYLLRDGELSRATIDHSYVQELVATGHITEAEARTHPRRNIVTRALGIEPNVRVDAWVLPIVRGDRFILCSDGLVDEVPDHEIADVAVGIADPQRAADELVAMANRHGGRDNTTVIVVDVIEGLDPQSATGDQVGGQDGLVGDATTDDGAASADADATTVLAVTAAEAELADPSATARDVDPAAAADATLPVDASSGDDTLVEELPPDDDTAPMDMALVEEAAARPRRRLTVGLFLILLAIAAVITVVITLIAVAVSDDDSPAPTTTVPTSTTTRPATTTTSRPTTTDAPATTTVTTTVAVSTNPPRTTATPTATTAP